MPVEDPDPRDFASSSILSWFRKWKCTENQMKAIILNPWLSESSTLFEECEIAVTIKN